MKELLAVMVRPRIERIGRMDYLGFAILIASPFLVFSLLHNSLNFSGRSVAPLALVLAPVFLVCAWCSILAILKRSADIGLAWWQIGTAFLVGFIIDSIFAISLFSSLIGLALHLIPGQKYDNRFGPAPRKILVFFE